MEGAVNPSPPLYPSYPHSDPTLILALSHPYQVLLWFIGAAGFVATALEPISIELATQQRGVFALRAMISAPAGTGTATQSKETDTECGAETPINGKRDSDVERGVARLFSSVDKDANGIDSLRTPPKDPQLETSPH
jgi:hypothetical protein